MSEEEQAAVDDGIVEEAEKAEAGSTESELQAMLDGMDFETDQALDEAIRELRAQLGRDPKNAEAFRELTRLLAEKERQSKEIEYQRRMIDIKLNTMKLLSGAQKGVTSLDAETKEKVAELGRKMRDLLVERGLHGASVEEFQHLAENATLTEEEFEKTTLGQRSAMHGRMIRKMEMTKRFKFINPNTLRETMRKRGREWVFYRFADMISKARFSRLDPKFATINRLLTLASVEKGLPAAVFERPDKDQQSVAGLALGIFGVGHWLIEEAKRRSEAEEAGQEEEAGE